MQEIKPQVCAVIMEETVAAAKRAIGQAQAEAADLLEVRLDALRDFDFGDAEELDGLLAERQLPVILTCRDHREGGAQPIADELRLPLLVEGAKRFADYCDVEAAHYEKLARLSPDVSKLMVSHHDFERTPADLADIYERLTRLPAAIHKFATRANTLTDSLATFRLLERAARDGHTLIAIAMGEAGLLTRLLGPSRGSFLTFGTLEDSRQSAPGQLTCRQLKQLYRLPELSAQTPIVGIIGNPVSHSASPAMHNAAFAALGLDFAYLPLEVDNLQDFFARLVTPASREFDWDLRGFSVTIPHKVSVIRLLDELDPTARAIGAVNTVLVRNGRLLGYNTDVFGAIEPLRQVAEVKDARVAVIGAGGAARAVIYGLVEAGATVTVFARDAEQGRRLADSFAVASAPIEALDARRTEILINTTPVGMRGTGEDQSPVPAAALRDLQLVYDLVYNPPETRLLKEARAAGCQTLGGLEMLLAQAARQFQLWTERQAPTAVMRRAALEKLR